MEVREKKVSRKFSEGRGENKRVRGSEKVREKEINRKRIYIVNEIYIMTEKERT